MPNDSKNNGEFKHYLEVRMTEIRTQLDELIDMHSRYGDTLQKSYIYKARRALTDGLEWFSWFRRKPNGG